jgi:hypothetical protein
MASRVAAIALFFVSDFGTAPLYRSFRLANVSVCELRLFEIERLRDLFTAPLP